MRKAACGSLTVTRRHKTLSKTSARISFFFLTCERRALSASYCYYRLLLKASLEIEQHSVFLVVKPLRDSSTTIFRSRQVPRTDGRNGPGRQLREVAGKPAHQWGTL